MKRLISLLLASVMLLSLAACGNSETGETTVPTTPVTTEPVETTTPATVPVFAEVDNPVTFFSMSLGEDYQNIHSITVYANENGMAYVDFTGEVKKVGDLDGNIFHGITAALAETGLAELNGMNEWGEGEANGSMYIEYADGTILSAGFSGEIPEAYTLGYDMMEAFFQELTAILPVYVPQPMIQGEPDETLMEEMTAILTGSGIQNLDAFIIAEVIRDEYMGYTLGMSDTQGVAAAVNCAPMMMTSAYSLVIVTLEDGADAASVCADFESNLDWMKWICVAPSDAMIAVKDNMVLCLMAADETYTMTAAGIEAAGWTVVNTLTNPSF